VSDFKSRPSILATLLKPGRLWFRTLPWDLKRSNGKVAQVCANLQANTMAVKSHMNMKHEMW